MKRILVPLDGSLLAEQALPTAVSMSRRHHATLDLILVNEALPGAGLEGWPWAVSNARTHGDYVASKARQIATDWDIAVEYAVGHGRAADEICRHARETGAELIVMTTRAHTGVARILGGSVADVVVRRSHLPVLLLRAATPGRHVRNKALHIERILIAVDGSLEAEGALDAAIALADRGVTELHLVEVVAPVPKSPRRVVRHIARVDHAATQRVMDAADKRLCALAASIAGRSGCDVFPHVVASDDVARGIISIARGFNASVIAMGTRGRGGSRLFLGSATEQVLADGRFPVLVVSGADPATAHSTPARQLEQQPSPSLRSG